MEAFIDFLIAFAPATIVSFVVGFLSVIAGAACYLRSKHFKRWMREEMKNSVDNETKTLRESNKRHSYAIRDIEKRLEKIEAQNEQLIPQIDTMSKEIREIYKIMIQKGGE